jgi:hypothetical protein
LPAAKYENRRARSDAPYRNQDTAYARGNLRNVPQWATVLGMRPKLRFICSGMILLLIATPGLRADVLEMQNGDRYSGKVISVSPDTVVLNNEVLGKITVPRNKVVSLSFGTNTVAPGVASNLAQPISTNLPAATAPVTVVNTNVDLSAAFRQLGANTNFVGQIRQQMLAGNPEATRKYDEMVGGLLSGQLSVNDIRQQAQSAATQLRELKRQLGPEADDSLDGYLQVLDSFVKETANEPADATPKSP